MQPSSAAAVVLLIAERNASGVISRFSDGNDTHDPGHSALRPHAPEAAEILSPPIKYPQQGIRNLLLA
jgi:hypothetical protein